MEGGVDPQGGLDPQRGQQSEPELDISALQTKIPSQIGAIQFEFTFYEPMMIETTFTKGPSIQPSYIELAFFGPAYFKSTYTKVPLPQAPPAPDHAPWMDLSAQVRSIGTHMEELAVISDTGFYSMEHQMDQY